MIRANRFARIALRIARATNISNVRFQTGKFRPQSFEARTSAGMATLTWHSHGPRIGVSRPCGPKTPKRSQKIFPGLPAWRVKKVPNLVDVSDFFYFFGSGDDNPRRGGGSPGRVGAGGGRGAGSLRGMWGGGTRYVFWGLKFPPSENQECKKQGF